MQGMKYLELRNFMWKSQEKRYKRFNYRYFPFLSTNPSSITRARDVLIHNKFWLASPSSFNDPFDCTANILEEKNVHIKKTKITNLFREIGPKLNWKKRNIAITEMLSNGKLHSSVKTTIESILYKLGVLCFAADSKNLLMWSHYANNHTGICFQFEIARDINIYIRSLSVNYTTKLPKINFFTFVKEDLMNILTSKHEGWKYENELRIIAPDGANKYLKFNADSLTGIILGCKISDETVASLMEILRERYSLGLPKIKLYRAHQSKIEYKLNVYKN